MSAVIDGKTVYAGNKKLMLSHELPFEEDTSDGTKIYVVEDKKYLGAVILSDTVKKNSRGVMLELKNDLKYSNVIFSSDCVSEVDAVKKSVGADKALAGATPQLKIEKFRQYGGNAFYVGDEMCDAKVLGKVEPSVAMNAKNNNSDFNIEDGEIRKVPEIVKISRRVKKIIRQNIFVSFGVKAVLAVLAAVLVITFDSDCFKWIFLTDTAIQILAVVNGLRNSSEIA